MSTPKAPLLARRAWRRDDARSLPECRGEMVSGGYWVDATVTVGLVPARTPPVVM